MTEKEREEGRKGGREEGRKGGRDNGGLGSMLHGENLLVAQDCGFAGSGVFFLGFGFRISLGFRYSDFRFPRLFAAAGRVE